MRDDVRLSLLVFFNLYLWLHVDNLNYGHQIHNTNTTVVQFDNNSHCEVRIAEKPWEIQTCQNMKEACLSSICSDQLNAEDLDLEKGGTTLLFIFLWSITCHEFRNL